MLFANAFLERAAAEADLEIMLLGTVKAKLIVAWYDTWFHISNCRIPVRNLGRRRHESNILIVGKV